MPIDELDPDHQMCYECEGTGDVECPACGGTGEDVSGGECPQCDGLGAYPCQACEGSGGADASDQRLSDYYADMKMDQRRTDDVGGMRANLRGPATESLTFDKFMDSIVMKESVRPGIKTLDDSPMRERARRNQDRPANKIKVGAK